MAIDEGEYPRLPAAYSDALAVGLVGSMLTHGRSAAPPRRDAAA